jgi:hypothetical protein
MKSHSRIHIEKFGESKRNDSILLIGDSHALMLKPFLNKVGLKNNFSFTTTTGDTFPAIAGINRKEVKTKNLKFYDEMQVRIPVTMKLIQQNRFIFLSIFGLNVPPSEYRAIRTIATNLRRDQHLILINTFPLLDRSPLRINAGYLRKRNYNFSPYDNKDNCRELKSIAEAFANVHFYNLNKGLITKTPGYINDTIAYYDRSHINTFASERMAVEMNDDFMLFFDKIRYGKN